MANNPDTWVIIGLASGQLANLVVWDGNETIWVPPLGTYAVPLDDLAADDLPQNSPTVI